MKYNITEITEYIENILSEFGLDFDISEEQEGFSLFDIHSDFNIDTTIQVVVSEEITVCYNINYNGKSTYTSRWSSHDNLTKEENKDNLYDFVSEFNDKLALLNIIIDDIINSIDYIKNTCNNNGIDYNDYIEDKM